MENGAQVQKKATRKIGLEIDASLYAGLSRVAKRNGQSRRFLLEQAVRLYLETTTPSQETVRPAVMSHFRKSARKNRKLLHLLAQ